MKGNNDLVVGPYLYSYSEGGAEVLESSIVVPIRDERLVDRGVVGIDVSQGIFQRSVLLIKPMKTGFAALYNREGAVAGNASADYLGKELKEAAADFPPADFERYSKAVLEAKETRHSTVPGGCPSSPRTRRESSPATSTASSRGSRPRC
jgi:hypothetical protein